MKLLNLTDQIYCVTYNDGDVVYVEYGVPEDIVDIQYLYKKKKIVFAKIDKIINPSPFRIIPICKHFMKCGGCQWQHIIYDQQLKAKEQLVIDKLRNIAHVTNNILPIIKADNIFEYRNKLEYTFSNTKWLEDNELKSDNINNNQNVLGFHKKGFYNKIINIEKCYLQKDISNNIRNKVSKFCLSNDYSFYDFNKHIGNLRNLIIKTTLLGEIMVIVQFGNIEEHKIKNLMKFIKDSFPEINSLQYVINLKNNETFFDLPIICYSGEKYIYEQMNHLKWRIGPKSFFQMNTPQAIKLYDKIIELGNINKNDIIYDFYTGIGTIALYIAKYCKRVIGIELIEEAIENAKINAKINNINNVEFFVNDIKNITKDGNIDIYTHVDIIIVDPPRSGLDKKVIDIIKTIKPSKLIYVSCNVSTQARDISYILDIYDIMTIQPIDMFPQTSHIENIIVLKIKE